MKYETYDEDVKVVEAELIRSGVTGYHLYPANMCVGVGYQRISCYYYVREGKIVEVNYD
jgi:hypothetical protein